MLRVGKNARIVRQGFSLVELLTVMAIMLLLGGAAVSSFLSLRATSLTAAGNQMAEVMNMARENAISKGLETAIIIKTSGTGAYSAYCLMELSRPDDGSAGTWSNLTSWKYLPTGVVFESDQSSLDTFILSPPPAITLPSLNFQGQTISSSLTIARCYQPDGSLMGNQSVRLRLIQGMVNATSGTLTYQGMYQGTPSAANRISYYDLILVANTGSTMVERP